MIMLLLGVTTLGVVTLICSAKSNGNKLNLGYIDAAVHLYSMQTRKFMDPRTCSTKIVSICKKTCMQTRNDNVAKLAIILRAKFDIRRKHNFSPLRTTACTEILIESTRQISFYLFQR